MGKTNSEDLRKAVIKVQLFPKDGPESLIKLLLPKKHLFLLGPLLLIEDLSHSQRALVADLDRGRLIGWVPALSYINAQIKSPSVFFHKDLPKKVQKVLLRQNSVAEQYLFATPPGTKTIIDAKKIILIAIENFETNFSQDEINRLVKLFPEENRLKKFTAYTPYVFNRLYPYSSVASNMKPSLTLIRWGRVTLFYTDSNTGEIVEARNLEERDLCYVTPSLKKKNAFIRKIKGEGDPTLKLLANSLDVIDEQIELLKNIIRVSVIGKEALEL